MCQSGEKNFSFQVRISMSLKLDHIQLVSPSAGQLRIEAEKQYKNNCVPLNHYSCMVITKKAEVSV